MGRIIDVSVGIGPHLVTWPSDPGIEITPAKRQDRGDSSNVSELRLGSHTGTHVDPPSHFLDGGGTVDRLDLDALVGPAIVADLRHAEGEVGPDELDAAGIAPGVDRLLLRTRNSDRWSGGRTFLDDYVAVSPEGARWLLDRGVRLVGIDFLSIERSPDRTYPVHRSLLGAGVVIVEGLDLSDVTPELYQLCCLPLRIVDGDGAPARAILIEP